MTWRLNHVIHLFCLMLSAFLVILRSGISLAVRNRTIELNSASQKSSINRTSPDKKGARRRQSGYRVCLTFSAPPLNLHNVKEAKKTMGHFVTQRQHSQLRFFVVHCNLQALSGTEPPRWSWSGVAWIIITCCAISDIKDRAVAKHRNLWIMKIHDEFILLEISLH